MTCGTLHADKSYGEIQQNFTTKFQIKYTNT